MASELVTPTAQRLTTYTRQDDNAPRDARISVAVNPPDEANARGIVYLDENTLHVVIDEAGILALLNEELVDYQAHGANTGGSFHNPIDNINTVDPTPVTSIVAATARANLLRSALLAHFANTGDTFHDFVDDVRGPLLTAVPAAIDVQSLRALVIAIKEYYNAHRNGNDSGANQIHPVNDNTNIVTTADPATISVVGPINLAIADVQFFTSSGSWIKPTDFTPQWTYVELLGDGGGGGSGARRAAGVSCSGGAGGGGGGNTKRWIRSSLLSSTETVTLGTGGAGGTSVGADDTNGNTGVNGTGALFGSHLRALGGAGGSGGAAGSSSAGGAGGRGDHRGGAGGDGANGAAGNLGADASGAAGGGAGGGIDGANVAYDGGDGGTNDGTQGAAATGGTGGLSGTSGGGGAPTTTDGPGGGGGGGGAGTLGGGSGGSGGFRGGGGGGGGASRNGFASGAGGGGAGAWCIVVTIP